MIRTVNLKPWHGWNNNHLMISAKSKMSIQTKIQTLKMKFCLSLYIFWLTFLVNFTHVTSMVTRCQEKLTTDQCILTVRLKYTTLALKVFQYQGLNNQHVLTIFQTLFPLGIEKHRIFYAHKHSLHPANQSKFISIYSRTSLNSMWGITIITI